MFDKYKFKKNFKLLADYVDDKAIKKDLLDDYSFGSYYKENEQKISEFINSLSMIYSKDVIKNIINEIIIMEKSSRLHRINESLTSIVSYVKKYHGDLEPINNIDFKIILGVENCEKFALDCCFKCDYKEHIKIQEVDIEKIFLDRSLDVKMKKYLYSLLTKENLDLFAAMFNRLKGRISFNDLGSVILNEEIDDIIYDKGVVDNLGNYYLDLVNYFFKDCNRNDRNVIIKILNEKNYDLLKDFMLFFNVLLKNNKYANKNISSYIGVLETSLDIISIKGMKKHQLGLITQYLSNGENIDFKYLNYLKDIIGLGKYNKLSEEYKKIMAFADKLDPYIFENLPIEEKRSLLTLAKSLDSGEKEELCEETKKLNMKVIKYFKKIYADKINESKDIILKAKQKHDVVDSKGNKHNLLVYELRDEEPFNFLITTMVRSARKIGPNMYDRPAHELTIEDPSNFEKELRNGSDIIPTSMINNCCINTFVGPYADIMYIFSDIDSDDFLSISPKDAAIAPKMENDIDLFILHDPLSPDELMKKTMAYRSYNEIDIKRKNKNNKKYLPKAILCFDEINDDSIKHAEYFNIPIIVIKTKTYTCLRGYTDEKKNGSFYGYR